MAKRQVLAVRTNKGKFTKLQVHVNTRKPKGKKR
jgi:hypothetical protein